MICWNNTIYDTWGEKYLRQKKKQDKNTWKKLKSEQITVKKSFLLSLK